MAQLCHFFALSPDDIRAMSVLEADEFSRYMNEAVKHGSS